MATRGALRRICRLADARAGHVAACLALLLSPVPAAAADQTLLLAVTINGHAVEKVGTFTDRDGAIFATAEEWRDLGIKVPEYAHSDEPIALAQLQPLHARVDQASQTIEITAPDQALLPLQIDAADPSGDGGSVSGGSGVALNYDITQVFGRGRPAAAGTFDLRAFWSGGVASSGFIAYSRGGPLGRDAPSILRLNTNYVISNPARMRQIVLGDFVSGSLDWSRPVRFAGVQLTTDFALRPSLITFPLPIVQGSAAVPSTLDVLVNGARTLTRAVEPGPFEVRQLPVVTGAGTVAMTLTDVAGHRVDVMIPFYASPALLAPGLTSYSLQAGAIRRNFGAISNDYGTFAASATYRRGLTRWTTVEATMEVAPGTAMAGGGVVLNLFDLAQVNSALAVSTGRRSGVRFAVGIQRNGPVLSAGVSMITASRGFADIAAISGEPALRFQMTAHVGASFGAAGSLGLAYSAINRRAESLRSFGPALPEVPKGFDYQPAQHFRLVSISYSQRVGRLTANLSGYNNLTARGGSGFLLGMTLPFGRGESASAGVGRADAGGFAQVQVGRTAGEVDSWGYRLIATLGAVNQGTGELERYFGAGRFAAAVDVHNGKAEGRLNARGALVIADGGLFATNYIPQSFAIVDTGGLPHVRVLAENRDVGRTDRNGRLLVPGLLEFDLNRISIDPTDVPPDVTLAATELAVRPQYRSGSVLRFAVKASHGATIRLSDAAGAPLPVGSTAILRANGIRSPVGYDGITYVEGLSAENELVVELPNGRRCLSRFAYTARPGEVPAIGPIPCYTAI